MGKRKKNFFCSQRLGYIPFITIVVHQLFRWGIQKTVMAASTWVAAGASLESRTYARSYATTAEKKLSLRWPVVTGYPTLYLS